jgi:hypothetical protein
MDWVFEYGDASPVVQEIIDRTGRPTHTAVSKHPPEPERCDPARATQATTPPASRAAGLEMAMASQPAEALVWARVVTGHDANLVRPPSHEHLTVPVAPWAKHD